MGEAGAPARASMNDTPLILKATLDKTDEPEPPELVALDAPNETAAAAAASSGVARSRRQRAPIYTRLIRALRDAVREQNPNILGLGNPNPLRGPLEILCRSAAIFYLASTRRGRRSRAPPLTEAAATALANLAVTGRGTYTLLQPTTRPMTPRSRRPRKRGSRQGTARMIVPAEPCGCGRGQALDRAYGVAWALRGPFSKPAAARRTLGWIAVSSKDDPPTGRSMAAGGAIPLRHRRDGAHSARSISPGGVRRAAPHPRAVPFHRCRANLPAQAAHLYTINLADCGSSPLPAYHEELIVGYVYATPHPGTIALTLPSPDIPGSRLCDDAAERAGGRDQGKREKTG